MPRQKQSQKPCKKCESRMAVIGEKYCKNCRAVVLKELQSSGYLTETTERRPPGDLLGRRSRNFQTLGGTAEMLNDGDD
jgi:hypothetical protein